MVAVASRCILRPAMWRPSMAEVPIHHLILADMIWSDRHTISTDSTYFTLLNEMTTNVIFLGAAFSVYWWVPDGTWEMEHSRGRSRRHGWLHIIFWMLFSLIYIGYYLFWCRYGFLSWFCHVLCCRVCLIFFPLWVLVFGALDAWDVFRWFRKEIFEMEWIPLYNL
jgi:hypothetical protein